MLLNVLKINKIVKSIKIIFAAMSMLTKIWI